MASQGPLSPSTVADDAAVGTVAWSSPTNAEADDASYATVTLNDTAVCFVAGTPILTPRGPVGIDRLRVGDEVCDGVGGHARITLHEWRVADVVHLLVTVAGHVLATSEHPFRSDGRWVPASLLRVGDVMDRADGTSCTLDSSTPLWGPVEVYRLSVESPRTYVAAGFIVHNK